MLLCFVLFTSACSHTCTCLSSVTLIIFWALQWLFWLKKWVRVSLPTKNYFGDLNSHEHNFLLEKITSRVIFANKLTIETLFVPRSLLMFTMENALIVALSQACRFLRDPGLDPRDKQFLKRELGSELVSIGRMMTVWRLYSLWYINITRPLQAQGLLNYLNGSDCGGLSWADLGNVFFSSEDFSFTTSNSTFFDVNDMKRYNYINMFYIFIYETSCYISHIIWLPFQKDFCFAYAWPWGKDLLTRTSQSVNKHLNFCGIFCDNPQLQVSLYFPVKFVNAL